MKYTEVLALINAGYTKDEIRAMEADTRPEDPEPMPEPEPQPMAEDPEPDAPELSNGQPLDGVMRLLHDMIQQNQQTLQAMQAANIRTARQPADEPAATPEDLIAKVIAPEPRKKGGK